MTKHSPSSATSPSPSRRDVLIEQIEQLTKEQQRDADLVLQYTESGQPDKALKILKRFDRNHARADKLMNELQTLIDKQLM